MRSIWLIFGCLLLGLLGLRFFWPGSPAGPVASPAALPPAVVLVAQRSASPRPTPTGPRDSLVRFALRQVGTPYVWAGTSPRTGFDCSGFITYVFSQFGVPTPHATALLIGAGQPVPRAQAQPGDIVVFTGTAEGSTTPGHAGIVISALGETPLRFVHASSARRESGVKVSQVENSGYERRFMQVRRVLGNGSARASSSLATANQPAAPRPLAPPPGAVAPLLPAAPKVAVAPATGLPARLAPVRLRPNVRASATAPRARAKRALAPRQPARTNHLTTTHKSLPSKSLPKKLKPGKSAVGKVSSRKAVPSKPTLAGKKTTRLATRPKPATRRSKPKSR